jgi:hypothetical protein
MSIESRARPRGFPLTLGLYFFSILVAAAWLIGAKWFWPGE